MSNPFDFDDGFRACDECGRTCPVEEAQSLLRLRYKGNVDYEGQSEYSRWQLVVCPRCHRRLMRRQWFSDLRYKIGLFLLLAFAVGVSALIVYGVLAGFGVVR